MEVVTLTSKMVSLKSSDGVTFDVEEAVALQSETIKHMMEQNNYSDNTIPLPNVTSKILAKVIEYCEKQVQSTDDEEEVKKWDAEFVNKVNNQATLYRITSAADYLGIESLLDLTLQAAADMIKGKAVEEIRKTGGVSNNLEEKSDLASLWSERAWICLKCLAGGTAAYCLVKLCLVLLFTIFAFTSILIGVLSNK